MILDTLLKTRAAGEDRAMPRSSFRHRHLSPEPYVIVLYKLAGDPASPIGVLCGTDPAQPAFFCAPEPRSREIRFELINPFMEHLAAYLKRFPAGRDAAAGAPQIVVPNVATIQFLEVLGRSLRFPGTSGLMRPLTVQTARHLTWLAEGAEHPGQALILPMTELLTDTWATGQSSLEDQHLASVLAWVDPPPGRSPLQASLTAEDRPTAGPVSSPQWDKTVLDPAMTAFNEARSGSTDPKIYRRFSATVERLVHEALTSAWEDTWRALSLMRELPDAPHAAVRHIRDVEEWHKWSDYASGDDVRLRNTLSDRAAVTVLSIRESATAELEVQEGADDPLRFAAQIMDGTGLCGVIEYTEPDRKIVPPGGRNRQRRPLIRVRLQHENLRFRRGDHLYWTERLGKVKLEAVEADTDTITLEIQSGTQRRNNVSPDLPVELGRLVRATALDAEPVFPKPLHQLRETWTHVRAAQESLAPNKIDSTENSAPAA